jgi:hypothetical protein
MTRPKKTPAKKPATAPEAPKPEVDESEQARRIALIATVASAIYAPHAERTIKHAYVAGGGLPTPICEVQMAAAVVHAISLIRECERVVCGVQS